MSNASKIEWTDATWNPTTGCTKTSPGCKHCYAERLWPKLEGARVRREGGEPRPFTDIRVHPERIDWPLHRKNPLLIFVNSMSDLFHEDVPDEFIDQVFAVMCKCCPQNEYQKRYAHTFQILTKRARRMQTYMTDPKRAERVFLAGHNTPLCGRASMPPWPLPNVWLGVSVENQAAADERIPLLLQTPAAVRWISAEPLLGPLNLLQLLDRSDDPQGGTLLFPLAGEFTCEGMNEPQPINGGGITWVVAGGESGPRARPAHPDWFRSLRDQCSATAVPFFFKQWGEWQEVDGEARDPETGGHLRVDVPSREADDTFDPKSDCLISQDGAAFKSLDGLPTDSPCRLMTRIGKRAAGRLLDGQMHNQYPASPLTNTKEPQ